MTAAGVHELGDFAFRGSRRRDYQTSSRQIWV